MVGAGLIGRVHIRSVAAHSGCRLLAIVDPSDAAGELAEKLQVPHFVSIEALLASHSPDGIILATPNQLHVSQALLCLNANVPTLLEKPVATTCAEGMILADEVRRTGIPLLVGHHRAHGDIMSRACEVIASGRLGQMVSFMGSAQFYKPADYFLEAPWRTHTGGGPILINMIHEVQPADADGGNHRSTSIQLASGKTLSSRRHSKHEFPVCQRCARIVHALGYRGEHAQLGADLW